MKRIHFEEIDSTNTYAKEMRSEGEDLIITATRQTGGRGTKGRCFVSKEGGVYLTTLRFYDGYPAKNAFEIMAGTAVAVCETLSFYGLKPVIKWSNDVFVNGKKICGILIENTLSGGNISSSIVGIGLNVNTSFEGELESIATSMRLEGGKSFLVEEVTERLIAELSKTRSMEKYRAYLGFMRQPVTLIIGDKCVPATLLSVDDEGRLHADIEGETHVFSSAEVSIWT